jgi:hypothetical protein
MWKPSILLAAALAIPAQALHFYIDGAIQKCFFEELPKDTLVVGTLASTLQAHELCNLQTTEVISLTINRPLPRRSLGRPDQILPNQTGRWRLRNRRGDVRQQPPHRRTARLITRPLHLQRCRFRPTSHLRHPSECPLGRRLAGLRRARNRKVHAGHGHWRDEQD